MEFKKIWPIGLGIIGAVTMPAILGISWGASALVGTGITGLGYAGKRMARNMHPITEQEAMDNLNRARTATADELPNLRAGDAASAHELEGVLHDSQNQGVRNEISQSLSLSKNRSELMSNIQRAMNLYASSLQKKDLKSGKSYLDYLKKASKVLTKVYDEQLMHGEQAQKIIDQEIRLESSSRNREMLVRLAAEKERVVRANEITRMQRKEVRRRILGSLMSFVSTGFSWLETEVRRAKEVAENRMVRKAKEEDIAIAAKAEEKAKKKAKSSEPAKQDKPPELKGDSELEQPTPPQALPAGEQPQLPESILDFPDEAPRKAA